MGYCSGLQRTKSEKTQLNQLKIPGNMKIPAKMNAVISKASENTIKKARAGKRKGPLAERVHKADEMIRDFLKEKGKEVPKLNGANATKAK